MLKRINMNPLNYLVSKIFIWFWVVIFSVISVTTLVVYQLDPSPEYSRLGKHHLRHLHELADYLSQSDKWISEPEKALRKHPFYHKRPFIVVSKDKHKVYSNVPLPRRMRMKHIFRLANSEHPQAVHFGDIKIKGPVAFTVKGQEFHVFSIYVPRHRSPSAKLRDLPIWIRILVPVLLSALLSYLLARSLARPILTLRQSTQQLANGDLDTRCGVVSARKDELGKLGQDFDNMAEKLSALVSAQQRLLGDVSHELRSPLARLKLAAGMLQDAKESDRQKLLNQIERESDRLDIMLGDVLRLSRLESQLALPEPEPIEINTLLQSLIDGVKIEAEATQKDIEFTSSDALTILGNPTLLGSAIENVLRNSIKYTEVNSVVSVSVSSDLSKQQIAIAIEDFGPGVDEDNIQKIFEPFYRESTSRTRQTGGTGLGLAISKRAITHHGGEISARNATNHSGLVVTIKLPFKKEN